MNSFSTFAEKRSASILIAVGGFLLATALFAIVGFALNAWVESGSDIAVRMKAFMGAVLASLFPIFAILGLFVGIRYLRKNGSDGIAIFGVLLNACGLAFCIFAFFIMFVLGATA